MVIGVVILVIELPVRIWSKHELVSVNKFQKFVHYSEIASWLAF